MSTWWYLECADHDPPLRSHDEFSQHTDDDFYRNGVALAMARPLSEFQERVYERLRDEADRLPLLDRASGDIGRNGLMAYFGLNAVRFLNDHPRCRLVLVNEYGEERSLEDEWERIRRERNETAGEDSPPS